MNIFSSEMSTRSIFSVYFSLPGIISVIPAPVFNFIRAINSVSMLADLLHHYRDLMISNDIPHECLNLKALLTLVNEHLHSTLRQRTETPNDLDLDCSQDFIKAVIESVKRQTPCGFHYFTSQKRK